MINLTSTYPNQIFLPVANTLLIAQVDTINNSGILSRIFPKKYGRVTGTAPDGSGSIVTQLDALIGSNATYTFQNLNEARNYVLQAANQTVNNPCYYVENVQPGYYQVVVWSPV